MQNRARIPNPASKLVRNGLHAVLNRAEKVMVTFNPKFKVKVRINHKLRLALRLRRNSLNC